LNWRKSTLLLASVGLLTAIVAAVFVFQDNIARFRANPRTPFQIAPPPPPPAYGARGAWVLWPDKEVGTGQADVFYVHSTTYYSGKSWNAPIGDAASDLVLKQTAAPNQAGPFLGIGPIFGPRYRQATLYAFFTNKFDGEAARRFAYDDVRAAFKAFLATTDGKRPLILAGYGQGGLHVQGLLQEFFQKDEALRNRLAVAYIINQATPLGLFKSTLAKTPPCSSPDDVRCVISYIDLEPKFDGEMKRVRLRSMSWSGSGGLAPTAGEPLLCVNPLTWTITEEYAGPEDHIGAASATGIRFGGTPPAVTHAVGAKCVGGILVVDRPSQDFLRRRALFGAKWRAQNYNLFYFDLAEDARRRAGNVAQRIEDEYMNLDPIEETIDLGDSPINKVPD